MPTEALKIIPSNKSPHSPPPLPSLQSLQSQNEVKQDRSERLEHYFQEPPTENCSRNLSYKHAAQNSRSLILEGNESDIW